MTDVLVFLSSYKTYILLTKDRLGVRVNESSIRSMSPADHQSLRGMTLGLKRPGRFKAAQINVLCRHLNRVFIIRRLFLQHALQEVIKEYLIA